MTRTSSSKKSAKAPAKTAVNEKVEGQLTIKDMLRNNKNTIAQALEETPLTPERLLSVCMTELRKTPKLRECTQMSLLGSIIQAAQLGVEPGSALGHCYLIPFYNSKAKALECQFMLGYRGMLELARRSGSISHIDARVAYEHDVEFEIHYGTQNGIIHKPRLVGERGGMMGVYAVAHFKDGGSQFEYMTVQEVLAVRDGSKAKDSGPWQTHFEEMAKKTVVRKLFKYLDVSVEAQTAAALDEQADAGVSQNNEAAVFGDDEKGITVDMSTGEIIEGPQVTSAADLNQAL